MTAPSTERTEAEALLSARCPLLGILRGVEADQIEPIAQLAAELGLPALEITMNTADAGARIAELKRASAARFRVGAGTVLNATQLETALGAGADFIVTPTLAEEVITICVDAGVPVFPGALTPTEIYRAWDLGATMVKVFPARRFGPDYFKEVKGPLDQIELLAVGGVTPDNAAAYLACGAAGLAFGGSIFKPELLAQGDFSQISRLLRELISACGRA